MSTTQQITATAATAAAAARDSLKTAELHHRFTQDIRKQIESEYNAAVDDEIAAAGDMDRKRRHAEETEESHKRIRSEAFRSLVKAKGGATCGFGLLGAKGNASQKAASAAATACDSDYEIEEGEIVEDDYISFTPCSPPSSPRCIF
jgi:chromosome segregation ATPase